MTLPSCNKCGETMTLSIGKPALAHCARCKSFETWATVPGPWANVTPEQVIADVKSLLATLPPVPDLDRFMMFRAVVRVLSNEQQRAAFAAYCAEKGSSERGIIELLGLNYNDVLTTVHLMTLSGAQ